MDPGENHHENEKKTESCAADGGLPVGMAGGRGLSARQLALADAPGARSTLRLFFGLAMGGLLPVSFTDRITPVSESSTY